MTRDRNDMAFKPVPAAANVMRPAYQPLGVWNGDAFSFHSSQDERAWRSQAYRQSVHPDRWQAQAPVDSHTQAALDGMPELGSGQFYRGPDGKHRRVTMDQREDADVQAIRLTAFDDFAKTGVTWTDLAAYDDAKPHPGEEEAIALSQANKNRTSEATRSVNMKRGMDVLPEIDNSLTRFTGDLDLGLEQLADPWSSSSVRSTPPAILVANNAKAVSVPAWLKGFSEPTFGGTKGRTTTPKQRQEFLESLIGKPANDNTRSTKIGRSVAPAPAISAAQGSNAKQPIYHKSNVGAGYANDPTSDTIDPNNIYYRARHDKANPPTAKEFAIYTMSDEGRFSYLEEMKDEWSRLVEAEPIAVLESMKGEVDNLRHYSNQNFFSAFHRSPTAAELAEINDVVEKVVFAPAEHWTEPSKSPDQRSKDGEAKPYLVISEGAPVSAEEAFSIVDEIFDRAVLESKRTGKAGNATTQRHVPMLAERMLAELKRCGIEVSNDPIKYEKQIKIHRGNKGARWGDFRIEFRVNGKTFALDVNHSAYLRSRYSRTPGEQAAFTDIVSFRRINVNGGEFADSEGAVISFPKIGKRQSEEEYLKQMDDFLKDLVDCKSPVKVRVTNPYDVQFIQKGQSDAANDG